MQCAGYAVDGPGKASGVDNSQRDLHGALLDAEILADVYLLMTGGQTALSLAANGQGNDDGSDSASSIRRLDPAMRAGLQVLRANADELAGHEERLAAIEKAAGFALWKGAPAAAE